MGKEGEEMKTVKKRKRWEGGRGIGGGERKGSERANMRNKDSSKPH